jgi:hypothetical protein
MTQMHSNFLSTGDNRKVIIQIAGLSHQGIQYGGTYRLVVPYSRLSQTIGRINRLGGRIIAMTLAGATAPDIAANAVETPSTEIVPSAVPEPEAASVQAPPSAEISAEDESTSPLTSPLTRKFFRKQSRSQRRKARLTQLSRQKKARHFAHRRQGKQTRRKLKIYA